MLRFQGWDQNQAGWALVVASWPTKTGILIPPLKSPKFANFEVRRTCFDYFPTICFVQRTYLFFKPSITLQIVSTLLRLLWVCALLHTSRIGKIPNTLFTWQSFTSNRPGGGGCFQIWKISCCWNISCYGWKTYNLCSNSQKNDLLNFWQCFSSGFCNYVQGNDSAFKRSALKSGT